MWKLLLVFALLVGSCSTPAPKKTSTKTPIPFDVAATWTDEGKLSPSRMRQMIVDGSVDVDKRVVGAAVRNRKHLHTVWLWYEVNGLKKEYATLVSNMTTLHAWDRMRYLIQTDDIECLQAAKTLVTKGDDLVYFAWCLNTASSEDAHDVLKDVFAGKIVGNSLRADYTTRVHAAISLLKWEGDESEDWLFHEIKDNSVARGLFWTRFELGLYVNNKRIPAFIDICRANKRPDCLVAMARVCRSFESAKAAIEMSDGDWEGETELLGLFTPQQDPVAML